MVNRFHLGCAIVLVALLSLCSACVRQQSVNGLANRTGSAFPPAPDEAVIAFDLPHYELKSGELDYIAALPPPALNIRFGSDAASVELPLEATEALNDHWKQALRFFYRDEFDRPKSAGEGMRRDEVWLRFCNSTFRRLEAVHVKAPLGDRNLSYTESENLYGSLNRAAIEVIKQVKEEYH